MQDGRLPAAVQLLSKPYRKIDLARMLREVLDAGETRTAATEPPELVVAG
jgi:hypothetical protein